MISLKLETKEVTLSYYPGLKDYLSQFKDPKVCLITDFGYSKEYEDEEFLIQQGINCVHTFIMIPKIEGALDYGQLRELHRSTDRVDFYKAIGSHGGTHSKSYEYFMVLDGGGTLSSTFSQSHMEGDEPFFTIGANYSKGSMWQVGMNQMMFDSFDATTGIALASRANWDSVFNQIGANKAYQGGLIQSVDDLPTYIEPGLVTKATVGGVTTWTWKSYKSSPVEEHTLVSAVIDGDYYKLQFPTQQFSTPEVNEVDEAVVAEVAEVQTPETNEAKLAETPEEEKK